MNVLANPTIYLSVCLSIYLSIYLPVCLSIYLSIQWNITRPVRGMKYNGICSNVDASRDDHTNWTKSEKERGIPYEESKNLYKWTNLQNRNRLIDLENKLMLPKGKESGGKN